MSPSMLLWLVGIAAAGVGLLFWGIRGKRINDHPVCRQCRFDLSGQPEGTITCSECGAGLKREGSVRIGQRRRRPIAIGLGSVAILLPVLTFGTLVFAIVTGQDLNGFKPIGLLAWEAKRADASRSKIVASELHRRMTVAGIAKEQYDRIVQMALEHQADVSRPWAPEWGDIIEQADTDGKLSKEDQSRYRRQAAVIKFEIRPRVRVGDDIPIVAKVVDKRVGGRATLLALAQFSEAKVDGTNARFMGLISPYGDGRLTNVGMRTTWFYLYGAQNSWGWGAGDWEGRIAALARIPSLTETGRRTVAVSLGTMVVDMPTGGGVSWPNAIKKDDPGTRYYEGTVEVELVPADSPGVELVAPSPDDVKKMELLLEPTATQGVAGGYLSMQFNCEGRPMDFAFDVFITSGEREWKCTPLASGTLAGVYENVGFGGDKQRQVWCIANVVAGTKVDVILRPSEAVARQTTDVMRIYGNEIVYKDVEFQWQGRSAPTGTRSFLGELVRGLFGG